MKNNPFEFLADQLNSHLPDSLKPFKEEVKTFSKKVIQERLTDLDLVPRSEYEEKLASLASAEAKIEALEKRINELEQK